MKAVMQMRKAVALAFAALIAGTTPTLAAGELNIYSARHYDSDEQLYDGFRAATGITVNLIEGNGPELLARMRAEGANSPADVFLTVDAGNLWFAAHQGMFQPATSPTLAARIPASLRDPKNLWYGFSTRARLIFVNRKRVNPALAQTYASLADPKLKGQICMRSSSAIYNLSLLGALVAHWGAARAETWVKSVVANFARAPQGNDTSLLKSVAAGECGITIANHYYYLRLKDGTPTERAAAAALTPVFPDQTGFGTHLNVSGAGVMAHAPHRAEAIRFLEYMASDAGQRILASGNHEFPAAMGAKVTPELAALGNFKSDPINVSVYGENQAQAQAIFDRAGWR
jgi:iron(III) transport system substrate-binding protein